MRVFALVGLVAVLAGCASTNTEILPIGNGLYMVGGQGGSTNWSGASIKSELVRKATAHCQAMGKNFVLASDKGQDASMYDYASAEIKFRCD